LLTKRQCAPSILAADPNQRRHVRHTLRAHHGLAIRRPRRCIVFLAAGALAANRMRAKIRHLTAAVNHMSQGLCMFDVSGRIVVCNQQYLRMYNLSPEVVKPGCTLRTLMEPASRPGSLPSIRRNIA